MRNNRRLFCGDRHPRRPIPRYIQQKMNVVRHYNIILNPFVLTDAKLAADSRYDFEVKSLPIK